MTKNAKHFLVSSPIIASLAAFLPLADALAQSAPCPFWGYGPGMMGGYWGWIGGIFMMFFWVLIIIAVVLFIRWLVTAGKTESRVDLPGRDAPLDILKKRYARGEISREELESMKRDIQ